METSDRTQWIAACAQRLGQRWSTVSQADRGEAAALIWADPALRGMAPADAAAQWLIPITVPAA